MEAQRASNVRLLGQASCTPLCQSEVQRMAFPVMVGCRRLLAGTRSASLSDDRFENFSKLGRAYVRVKLGADPSLASLPQGHSEHRVFC